MLASPGSAMTTRVSQQRDEAEHLHEGARPSMRNDDRERRRPSPLFVDEVDADAIHRGAEVGKRIDRPLLRPPVNTEISPKQFGRKKRVATN